MNMKITQAQVFEVQVSFCPFGYLDIEKAIKATLESGHNLDYVYYCCDEFCFGTGSLMVDIDPVYCVYNSILEEARNEIEEQIQYDFCNGDGYIDTIGNFICTSYNWDNLGKENLIRHLQQSNIIISELSKNTQWFLDQIEIYQSTIEEYKEV